MKNKASAMLLLMAVLNGCATTTPLPPAASLDSAAGCEQFFKDLDGAIAQAGVRDGGYASIAGHAHLRTDRFLASYRDDPLSEAQTSAWMGLMKDLDVRARAIEVANLPDVYRDRGEFKALKGKDAAALISRCGDRLLERDLREPGKAAVIRQAIAFPDEYQDWKRAVGLYPLTAQAFLHGVADYQAETMSVFDSPLETLPINGRLVRYVPPAGPAAPFADLGSVLERARSNPLRIPLPNEHDLQLLLAAYAPVLEIDQVGRADRIGKPAWRDETRPDVDVSSTTVFVRVAHARYGDETLLQLVYSVWFPERPRTSPFDLLGGTLDGITWRVTLDRDGAPLLFDAMHNCGCYHMFFPTDALGLRPGSDTLEEPILVPSRLRTLGAGERVVLRIASGSHYIQHVRVAGGPEADGAVRYAFSPDDQLRSLESEAGTRRSLFRPDGIVSGTQRGERYFFWPMGIPEPGAMRQWGRHATAFVGRRHFDDPDLVERYFEYPAAGLR